MINYLNTVKQPISVLIVSINRRLSLVQTLRPDFTSQLVYGLALGTPKLYNTPYGKINHGLVNLSYNCDAKSGLNTGTLPSRTPPENNVVLTWMQHKCPKRHCGKKKKKTNKNT